MADMDKKSNRSFVTGHNPEIGRDSFAGLPGESVMELYPKQGMDKGRILNDTMTNVDITMTDSEAKTKKYYSNQK